MCLAQVKGLKSMMPRITRNKIPIQVCSCKISMLTVYKCTAFRFSLASITRRDTAAMGDILITSTHIKLVGKRFFYMSCGLLLFFSTTMFSETACRTGLELTCSSFFKFLPVSSFSFNSFFSFLKLTSMY